MKKYHLKNLIKAGCLIILCFILSSNTSNNYFDEFETRLPGNFTNINLAIGANVYLIYGPECKLEIESDEAELSQIETVVSDGTLDIKARNRNDNIKGKVMIKIFLPDVKKLSVTGSGKISSDYEFVSDKIKLSISGSGSINLEKNGAENIDAVITGSGNIHLNGGKIADHLGLTITGSGSYSSMGMKVSGAEITITGSGSAKVNVINELKTNITGSGNVLYAGDPLVNAKSTGSGKTKKL